MGDSSKRASCIIIWWKNEVARMPPSPKSMFYRKGPTLFPIFEELPHEFNDGNIFISAHNVIEPPANLDAPGEMGRPVILPTNMTAETKKLVDEGWLNNAFNQYASDLISVHRSLPDPRDEWWVLFHLKSNFFNCIYKVLFVLCLSTQVEEGDWSSSFRFSYSIKSSYKL